MHARGPVAYIIVYCTCIQRLLLPHKSDVYFAPYGYKPRRPIASGPMRGGVRGVAAPGPGSMAGALGRGP